VEGWSGRLRRGEGGEGEGKGKGGDRSGNSEEGEIVGEKKKEKGKNR